VFDQLAKISLLLVDRQAFMRRIMRSLLVEAGARHVVELAEGASFLATVAALRPGLVVLDIDQRPFDGPELVWHLRRLADERVRRTPVILMAAGATMPMVQRARNFGCDEFLCKPVSAKALQARLESALLHQREFIDVPSYVGPCRRRFVNPLFEGDDRRDGGAFPGDYPPASETVLLA
jgi:CheY-like chemotaxis protein